MVRTIAVSLGLLFTVATAAEAQQVGRDMVERGSNRGQISQGQQDLERDGQELAAFSATVAQLDQAVGSGDSAAASAAAQQLGGMMQNELQQGQTKAQAAQREVAGAVSETGSNRRESRRNRDDSNRAGRSDDDALDAMRDGANRVDDAADVADDRRDFDAIQQRVARQGQIAQQLGGSAGAQQLALAREFEQLMRDDIAGTQAEIDEDRREAGEDRRETRDDLRELDEVDNRVRRETGNYGRRDLDDEVRDAAGELDREPRRGRGGGRR